MIYFAKLPTGSIKIGTSVDVDRRAEQLAAHYGCDVEIIHTIDGGRDVERQLHERFSHLRFGRTEQFHPGPDLAEFIGLPLFVAANPATVEIQLATGDTKAVRLDLDITTHRMLRLEAAKLGKPMAVVVRDLVVRWLESRRDVS